MRKITSLPHDPMPTEDLVMIKSLTPRRQPVETFANPVAGTLLYRDIDHTPIS